MTLQLNNLFKVVLIKIIRFYQLAISPMLPNNCRYQPTCSAYAIEAIHEYGALKGAWLAFKRVIKCHPLGGSGYDPVPKSKKDQNS